MGSFLIAICSLVTLARFFTDFFNRLRNPRALVVVVSDVCRPLRARPRARRPRHFRRGAAAAASRSRVGAAGRGGQPASQPASRRWCEEGGALWPLHTAAAGGRCRTRVQPLRAARRTAVSASCSSCSSASCASSSARAARASSCASSCRDGAASVVAGGGGAGTAGAKAAAGCRANRDSRGIPKSTFPRGTVTPLYV